ncbi:acyl carrier protein [Pseudomonas soli]|uniref:acyl carrier protein n=1 Tax=Pseudomonas soli TaxID=1306993 RepID=UPI0003C7D3B7|nr:hypothetical protein O165_007350 [Pseudomonas soli]
MSTSSISNTQVAELLSRLFPDLPNPVDPKITLHAQGVNSMGMIVLITHLQDEFGIVFDTAAFAKLHALTLESLQGLCIDHH